ncbi:MAG: hypothetical protein V3V08_26125 [Nannocystaceae bacterium]
MIDDNVTRVSDTDGYGEVARVVRANPGPGLWELRIIGYDVDGVDDPVCGNDSIQVFYAFFYEDSDRDDSNGPDWNSSTMVGVAPEG